MEVLFIIMSVCTRCEDVIDLKEVNLGHEKWYYCKSCLENGLVCSRCFRPRKTTQVGDKFYCDKCLKKVKQ